MERLPARGSRLGSFSRAGRVHLAKLVQDQRGDGQGCPDLELCRYPRKGPVAFFEDAERLRGIVTKLTEHHEAYSTKPWKVTDAPPDYISGELKQIVGFEMPVVKIEGKWKMNQNRPDADRNSVMTHLLERDRLKDEEVSHEMKRREP
jgi:transcriptional regulator